MSNNVMFELVGVSTDASALFVRITGLSREVLFEGNPASISAAGMVTLPLPNVLSGTEVIVTGDDYSQGNETTYRHFSGVATVVGDDSQADEFLHGAGRIYEDSVLWEDSELYTLEV